MSLFCPNCAYLPEEQDEPWCHRCGHNFISEPDDADGMLPAISRTAPARRTGVIIDRFRKDCVCYGEHLRHDPLTETMASVFVCGRIPERIDCVGCPICTACGDLRCTCGMLSISVGVKVKGAVVIDTVPVRDRLF